MDVIIYKISSFTLNGSGGNKAGVVLEADGLTSKDMLRIANNVGYSETAFVMNSKIANFKVRFFTPLSEVDLCGHATIAVFNLLQQKEIINLGIYTQETKAGVLRLDIREDALSEIAKKAIERKTGARGLRSILESILMETMYKVPSEESLNKVVLDASVVKGESEPLMVYEKSSKTKTG